MCSDFDEIFKKLTPEIPPPTEPPPRAPDPPPPNPQTAAPRPPRHPLPPSVQIPPAHREDAATAANNTPDNASVDEASINGNGAVPKKPAKSKAGGGPMVEKLTFIDYRYYRFLLHPDGMFRMVRCVAGGRTPPSLEPEADPHSRRPHRDWKDPCWTSIAALRQGLSTDTDLAFRKSLFDSNAIEIEAKGIGALLMDEVLHPFYIFQIFSIALWSVDDYYCGSKSRASTRQAPETDCASSRRLRLCDCGHLGRLHHLDSARNASGEFGNTRKRREYRN